MQASTPGQLNRALTAALIVAAGICTGAALAQLPLPDLRLAHVPFRLAGVPDPASNTLQPPAPVEIRRHEPQAHFQSHVHNDIPTHVL